MSQKMSKKQPGRVDLNLGHRRCYSCGSPLDAPKNVETFETPASTWITAQCPECNHWSPFRLESYA